MTFAPNPVTTEQLVDYLTDKVGTDIGCSDIRSAAKVLDVGYETACRRLKEYKTGIGKWNLTTQQIEKLYEAPAAQPAVEQSYIPDKDASYVQFGTYTPIKKIVKSKLFYPAFITGLSGLSLIHI